MAIVVLDLEVDTAGHLAVALWRHRTALEQRGGACPAGLAKVEAVAAHVAKSGQECSPASIVRAVSHADLHEREHLSPSEVATVTSTSLSTVRRWLRSEGLRSAFVGRRRLIARADLEAFLESRRQPA